MKKQKMNVLFKIAFILLIICVLLILASIIIAYAFDSEKWSAITSASGVLLASVGIILGMLSKPKKVKLKDENKIDAKKAYSDEILALIKRISENMPTLCDEDQKEYDRFKVLTRTKMSSEIQELLAKNERKDIDKAKIYIYYIT